MGLGSLFGECCHLLGSSLHGLVEVVLGELGSLLDSLVHLSLKSLAGLSVLLLEVLDRLVGLGTELADLGTELGLDEELGVGIHLVAALLDERSALLTGGDGLVDGGLELLDVGILDGVDLGTTLLGLEGIGVDNAGQLLDLLVGLGVVLGDDLGEVDDLFLELALGRLDVATGLTLGAEGSLTHRSVLLFLPGEVGRELLADGFGGLLELALGVAAVAGKLLADTREFGVEAGSHLVQLAVGLRVVFGDRLLELGISLEVLAVTLVAKLDP